MTVIAAALRELIAAGVTGDALVTAIERIELSLKPKRSSGAERTAKWREKKKREEEAVTSDAVTAVTSQASHETRPLIETEEDRKEEKKERGRKTRPAPLPTEWHPPERAYAIANELGVRIQEIEPRFRDYLASSGKLYADYDAGFCNFVRNTPKFNGAQNGQGHRSLASAADDLIARAEEREQQERDRARDQSH